MKPKFLYFTVFSSGMTTLAIELAASRLLGSVFGTSNLVWASIIGLILIYLTLGYFVGGRWADRSPYPSTFFSILAWGAFTAGVIPFISRPVLQAAANAFDNLEVGILFGSFSAVLILFIVPVTLLGTISPFAIRLALRDSTRGRSGFWANLCDFNPGIFCRDIPSRFGIDSFSGDNLYLFDLWRVFTSRRVDWFMAVFGTYLCDQNDMDAFCIDIPGDSLGKRTH